MKLKILKMTVASLVLSVSGFSSNAALIDNSTYTTDSITGLDWLDLTASLGRSYNDVVSNMGSGGLFEGWQFGTVMQVEAFLTNGFVDTLLENNDMDRFVDLVGATGVGNGGLLRFAQGRVLKGSPTSTSAAVRFAMDDDRLTTNPDTWSSNNPVSLTSSSSGGSWLVRSVAVPEPPTLAIFALGMIGLASCRFKKQP